jgi:hypothetical protein
VARKPALDAESVVAAESAFDSLLYLVDNFVRGCIETPVARNYRQRAATQSIYRRCFVSGIDRRTRGPQQRYLSIRPVRTQKLQIRDDVVNVVVCQRDESA